MNASNTEPNFAINMSLGLTMKSDPGTQNTVACGPTIPKDCKSYTMYNGVCFQIDQDNRFGPPIPSSVDECLIGTDIAFLLDGSGSVNHQDFQKMKTFVKNLVGSFLSSDTMFSVSQFSTSSKVHYYFNNFFSSGSWKSNIDRITQLHGGTYTAKAIEHIVQNVFTPQRGSRSNAKKVLIVITDGESQDSNRLPYAAQLAESKKIVRFAIGVGDAFNKPKPKQELDTIASFPSDKHVFQVRDFNALEIIRQTLEKKISIEGSQTSGESLRMEMAQEGFNVGIQMSIVGANQWTGGYTQFTAGYDRVKTYEMPLEPDSYLGYSMAIAKTQRGSLTVIGAPRFKHRGTVLAYQTGEYFGAEVCTMDINNDAITDLIFISAPMHMEPDREGRVYVCRLTGLCNFDDPLVLRGHAAVKGRFGSSLAVLPDLNSDGFRDLAVGAPLENDGEGSIYIFHSEGGGRISPTYSQRITGSEVESGLKFFGLSISQSSFDQSGDGLPDLAVGSKGKVVLLRSRPIVIVKTDVSFSPKQILTQNADCSKPLENTAELCFTMSRVSTVNTARIHYTLTLDATRKPPNNRAYISGKQQEHHLTLNLNHTSLFLQACPEDSLNVLSNELKFTFDGLSSNTDPKPSLSPQAKTTTIYPLGFETNCGNDNKCVDNLKVDFNFTRSSEVKVGIDELLNVTVTVENRGENSYNSHVILTYPAGLSYRKFTSQQERIECNPLDSEDGLSRGRTDCTIDKPIFKSKTKVCLFSLYIKYVLRSITNDIRALNFTVVIRVPVKLGEKDIWVDLNFKIQIALGQDKCSIQSSLNHQQDCSVARCRVFKCNTFLERLMKRTYEISANLSSGWIEQIGLQSAKFLLTSTVSLEYDKNQYIYFSTGSDNPPVRKVTVVEVYPEPNFTKEIIGGCLGGLAFLALLTAGLYKAGFFKSKYKQMINENPADVPGPGTDATAE
uniref:VWFA domain-containing protein n=1 Tax=Oreochromis aureus TaxID=47969 RepID=A0AAZ1Y426_OREAU